MAVQRSRRGSTYAGGDVFEVRGADDLAKLSKALKQAADKELRSELYKGINRVTAKARKDLRVSAKTTLPRRGGLGKLVSKSKITTRRRIGTRTAGISIIGGTEHDIKRIDQGVLRHPVYGNENRWVTQQVTPGWWTKPLEAEAPAMRRELILLIARIDRNLRRKVH